MFYIIYPNTANIKLIKTLDIPIDNPIYEQFVINLVDEITTLSFNYTHEKPEYINYDFIKNYIKGEIVLILDKILLENIFQYYIEQNINALLYSIHNKTFGYGLVVSNNIVNNTLELLLSIKEFMYLNDYKHTELDFELKYLVKKRINELVMYLCSNKGDKLHQILIETLETFINYTTKNIAIGRFHIELLPRLNPVVMSY